MSLTETINTCIEIGAGTGTATKEFAKTLEHIEAYEPSPSMFEICVSKLSALNNVKVNLGDLAQILKSKVNEGSTDIVIANFHVFSYFTDEEVARFAEVCRIFLKSGGLVAFDFWDLEEVIALPPIEGARKAYFLNREIMRTCKPELRNDSREVHVNFEFWSLGEVLFKETHIMFPRYLHEVLHYFEASFEFCGRYDQTNGELNSRTNYGKLVFLESYKNSFKF